MLGPTTHSLRAPSTVTMACDYAALSASLPFPELQISTAYFFFSVVDVRMALHVTTRDNAILAANAIRPKHSVHSEQVHHPR